MTGLGVMLIGAVVSLVVSMILCPGTTELAESIFFGSSVIAVMRSARQYRARKKQMANPVGALSGSQCVPNAADEVWPEAKGRKWFYASLELGIVAIIAHITGLFFIAHQLTERTKVIQGGMQPSQTTVEVDVIVYAAQIAGLLCWLLGITAWILSIVQKEDNQWRLIPLAIFVGYVLVLFIIV